MRSMLVGVVVGVTWWGGGLLPRGYPLWYLVFLRHVILAGFVIAAARASTVSASDARPASRSILP